MHYLAAGLFCLVAVAWAGSGPGRWIAAALALAAAGYAFFVYRWWVPPAAAATALAAGYAASRYLPRRPFWLGLVGAVGAVLSAFSVVGPRDGLF